MISESSKLKFPGMDQISELVNEHPFDANLQGIFIKYVKDTQSASELHAARLLSNQFVDFNDGQWISWILDSRQLGIEPLTDVLSRALEQHPSVPVLEAAVQALPAVVEAGWNSWTVFPPRPTAVKSAVRYMEQALEKVSTWADSGPMWTSCRSFLVLVASDKESVRKLYLRQLQAVPMPSELRDTLISEQRAYEESVGLSPILADTTKAAAFWDSWSEWERHVKEDPAVWMEAIESRKSFDAPDTIAALFARAVTLNPSDAELWLAFAHCTRSNERAYVSALERGVKNCPAAGELWVMLAAAVSDEKLDNVLLLGISALRDSVSTDGNPEALARLLLFDANKKLNANDIEARESFSTAVSILAELSAELTVIALLAWLHAEAYHPLLTESEDDVVVDLIREFVSSADWTDKRTVCTVQQWVQLAWIARKASDFVDNRDDSLEFCRSVYLAALNVHPADPIITADLLTLERTFGSVKEIARIESLLVGTTTAPMSEIVKPTDEPMLGDERSHKRSRPDHNRRHPTRRPEEKKPKPESVPECIFVKDLAFAVSEERLGEFFEKDCSIAAPKRVHIVKTPEGKSRGFGYVEFESAEAAQKAIEMSGKDLDGRVVHISQSTRHITTKRETVAPETLVEEKDKSNDYFRSLIMQRQKRR